MAKFQYKIIADKILADIKKEILLPGMNAPSSRDLSKIYNVSHFTAMSALEYLARRGILLHKRGKNYVVSGKLEKTGTPYQFLALFREKDAPLRIFQDRR